MRLRSAATAATLALALTTGMTTAAHAATPTPMSSWPAPGAKANPAHPVSIVGDAVSLQPDASRKPLVVVEDDQEKGGKSFTIPADVLFDTDSATLTDNATANIADVVKKLQEANVTGDVRVIGHTDTTGTKKHNLKLSKQRARSVADAMSGKLRNTGIIPKPTGVGQKDPLVKNDTEAHRKRNRRVAIIYQASDTGSQGDDEYDISVPFGQAAFQPRDASTAGSAQRTLHIDDTTYTIRADVVRLKRQDGLLRLDFTTTLVSQDGDDTLDGVGPVFSGTTDISDKDDFNAFLYDPAKRQQLNELITGKGGVVQDIGTKDELGVGGVRFGYVYFPAPAKPAKKLSLYIPSLGTINNIKIT